MSKNDKHKLRVLVDRLVRTQAEAVLVDTYGGRAVVVPVGRNRRYMEFWYASGAKGPLPAIDLDYIAELHPL